MEITKRSLIELIKKIDRHTDLQQEIIANQGQEIRKLQIENAKLQENNQQTLLRIKEYIQELEQIKSHYVSSYNKFAGKKV